MTELLLAVGFIAVVVAGIAIFERMPSSGDGVDWEYEQRHSRANRR